MTTPRRSPLDGWEIQRRCPHLKADLSKFGVVEDSTPPQSARLAMGLATGRCLTARGYQLRCSRTCQRTAAAVFYDDGLVQLDRHALTLRRYHFPSGTSESHSGARDPRVFGRAARALDAALPAVGQF